MKAAEIYFARSEALRNKRNNSLICTVLLFITSFMEAYIGLAIVGGIGQSATTPILATICVTLIIGIIFYIRSMYMHRLLQQIK